MYIENQTPSPDQKTIDGKQCCGDCYYTAADDGYCRLCPLHAAALQLLTVLDECRRVLESHNQDGRFTRTIELVIAARKLAVPPDTTTN